jgi:hypothetical protein
MPKKVNRTYNGQDNAPISAGTSQVSDLTKHETTTRAADRFAIFEQVALERLQAGADATKAASFLPLPVRLSAISGALIAGAGVLWSVVARVPVQVSGTAAIVPSTGMASLSAGSTGQVFFQVSGLGANQLNANQLSNNRLLKEYWNNDAKVLTKGVDQELRLDLLARAALAPITGQELVLPQALQQEEAYDTMNRPADISYPSGTVIARIFNTVNHNQLNSALLTSLPSSALQNQQRKMRLERATQLGQLESMQRKQRVAITAELRQRRELYNRYVSLWEKGYLPATTLLAEQSTINSLESQLLSSDSSAINTSINQRDQIDQSRQASISNLGTRSALETAVVAYLSKSTVFAPDTGFYILASSFNNGSTVREGDELLSYTLKPPALPQEVPVLLDAVAAQQVSDGMAILLTPRGISRAQYGGIPGKVVQVTKLPLQGDGLLGVLGSRALVTTIQRQMPAPYLVRVRLEQAEPKFCNQALSKLCYKWSSGRKPPHPVRLATLADVQITTTYRRPIEFVMPAVNQALGLVIDNQ